MVRLSVFQQKLFFHQKWKQIMEYCGFKRPKKLTASFELCGYSKRTVFFFLYDMFFSTTRFTEIRLLAGAVTPLLGGGNPFSLQ